MVATRVERQGETRRRRHPKDLGGLAVPGALGGPVELLDERHFFVDEAPWIVASLRAP